MHGQSKLHTHAPLDDCGEFCQQAAVEVQALVAVFATLSKGSDLDYIWRQVCGDSAKDAAGYYIQASGEPPGPWWGTGARALCLEHGRPCARPDPSPQPQPSATTSAHHEKAVRRDDPVD